MAETIYETQNGSSSEPAPYAAVLTLPSAEGNGSTDNGKTKKVRGGYQKMIEVRIPPYVKNKLATERVYVYRKEDYWSEADEQGYVTQNMEGLGGGHKMLALSYLC